MSLMLSISLSRLQSAPSVAFCRTASATASQKIKFFINTKDWAVNTPCASDAAGAYWRATGTERFERTNSRTLGSSSSARNCCPLQNPKGRRRLR